jgi:hypothetical protein
MICDRKCIYIHQPKTGGNTVANIIQDIVSDSSRVMGMHYTMRGFVSRFPEIDLNEYTVLTVTRNPWERYASLHMQQYINWKRGGSRVVPYNEYFTYPYTSTDLFYWLEIDDKGTLPPNIKYLHFDNLSDDLMLFANRMGFYPNTIPKLNTKKDSVYSNMDRIIINDPIFQKLIAKSCKQEIEYFEYTIPTFNNLEISNKFIY